MTESVQPLNLALLPLDSAPHLTLAVALAAGMAAQIVARHLRIPGIVLLLAVGVLLGPDGVGIVQPEGLGPWLLTLVGFAVAVVLFEGGMSLDLKRLRREGRAIRQLVTWGALITWAGAALAARLFLGWSWPLAVLFGSLVIVTGPTVINPLLRRLKVRHNVATILEAEGILGDAIGAIVAVVALEVVITPGSSLGQGAWDFLLRLGFGGLVGAAAGFVLAFALHSERAIPAGLKSVATLASVIALFELSNAVIEESGIVAAIAAGLVAGNSRARAVAELREFKEQLTILLIGLLFVLLAADVRLSNVAKLGWPAVATVVALMLVVRPLNVLVGTAGTGLAGREKAFLAWLAPRGIVAAAVSSLFAESLAGAGIEGGQELRAMVFLVIAVTVVVQGLSGGLVATALGVRRPPASGYALMGAEEPGLSLARVLREAGEEVVLIDSNADACRTAEDEGFRVLHGSGLDERIQLASRLDSRTGAIGATTNEEVNLLFARRAHKDYKVARIWVALRRGHVSLDTATVAKMGGRILFGRPQELPVWQRELERGAASVILLRAAAGTASPLPENPEILLLAVRNGKSVLPVDERTRNASEVFVALAEAGRTQLLERLAEEGWTLAEPPP